MHAAVRGTCLLIMFMSNMQILGNSFVINIPCIFKVETILKKCVLRILCFTEFLWIFRNFNWFKNALHSFFKIFWFKSNFWFFDEVITSFDLSFISLQGFVVSSYFTDILQSSQWKNAFSFKPLETAMLYEVLHEPILCHWSLSIPLKTLENLWFSDVFRGYKKILVARNSLRNKR